jgi:hypothetical protein
MAKERKHKYSMVLTKEDKYAIVLDLISAWRNQDPPGRFLKKNKSDGNWYEVNTTEARSSIVKLLWRPPKKVPCKAVALAIPGNEESHANRVPPAASQGDEHVYDELDSNRAREPSDVKVVEVMAGTYQALGLVIKDADGDQATYTGAISIDTNLPHGYGRLEYNHAGRWYEGKALPPSSAF